MMIPLIGQVKMGMDNITVVATIPTVMAVVIILMAHPIQIMAVMMNGECPIRPMVGEVVIILLAEVVIILTQILAVEVATEVVIITIEIHIMI